MEDRNKTPFTSTNGVTPFSVYLDAENAIAPLEEAIQTLEWLYVDFDLGHNELDGAQKLNLLTNYQSLGAIILCVAHTLEKVVEDFNAVKPKKDPTTEATQSTTTGKATTTEPDTIIPEGRE